MFKVKVSGMSIIIIDNRTKQQVSTINCTRYLGVASLKVEGDVIRVLCKDHRTRLFDATTGRLKRTV
jgi:hypothetical protein